MMDLGANKSVWEWSGNDELSSILKEIDKNIVKIDGDTERMERAMKKSFNGSARSIDYLRDKVRKLQYAFDNSFDEKRMARYNREIQRTRQEIERIQRLGLNRGSWRDAANQMPIANQLMGFAGNPYVVGGMAALAVGRFAGESVSYARHSNTDMAKINATAQLTPEAISALRDSFFPMANRLKVDVNSIPAAYEGLISATGDKAMASRLLEPTLKLSKAGFTDPSVVGKALSQILMTPGVAMNENKIADMLISAKNYGRGELGDFANYLPGLITTGKLRGFSEADVVGGYSYLTRSNSAETAGTLMSNFMNVVLRKDVTDKIKEKINVDVFDKEGGLRDLSSIVGDIGRAMNGLSDRGKQSFLDAIKVVDMQAFQALGALTSESDKLNEAIQTVENSSGELAKTLQHVKDGNESLVEFGNNWNKLKNNIGQWIAPKANRLMEGINYSFASPLERYQALVTSEAFNPSDKSSQMQRRYLYDQLSDSEKLAVDKESKQKDASAFFEKHGRDFFKKNTTGDQRSDIDLALANINKITGGKWTDKQYMGAVTILKKIWNEEFPKSNPTVPRATAPAGGFSSTPDKLMQEYKQVRNVTVNIDTLQKIMSVNVSSSQELAEFTSEPALNELIKIIRNAEQAAETY